MLRRDFAGLTLGATGLAAFGRRAVAAPVEIEADVPSSIDRLQPMTNGVVPIGDDERRARIEKAQRLMAENGIGALMLERGTSMLYFTGVRWGLSERPFVVVIPARGELAWVTPAFEEERARELIKFSQRRARLAGGREPVPRDRRHPARPRRRDAARSASRSACASSSPTACSRSCRARRFVERHAGHRRLPHDQVAGRDRAHAAGERHHARRRYKAAFATLHEGMTQFEFQRNVAGRVREARRAGRVGALVAVRQVHRVSARQHPAAASCARATSCSSTAAARVEGYASDITRTTVFGRPTAAADATSGISRSARRPRRSPPRRSARRASRSTPRRAR